MIQITITQGPLRDEMQRATLKRYTADQEAYALTADGKAKAKNVKVMGDALAHSLRVRLEEIAKAGRYGQLLAQMDAMQANQPGKTVIWANNPFVRGLEDGEALGSIMDSLGIKSSDDLKRLVRELAEMNRGGTGRGGRRDA